MQLGHGVGIVAHCRARSDECAATSSLVVISIKNQGGSQVHFWRRDHQLVTTQKVCCRGINDPHNVCFTGLSRLAG